MTERVSPLVSIVVPAHNEEALLPACLDALLAQDASESIEIIVVENGSTDSTARVACRPGVTVVRESGRDYCRALIRGFAEATGDIIAMTDADSIALPKREFHLLGIMIGHIVRHTTSDIRSSIFYTINGKASPGQLRAFAGASTR